MDNTVSAQESGFKAIAIVRDKYGRIVIDESIFFNPELLELFRKEVIKNGRNTSNSNP